MIVLDSVSKLASRLTTRISPYYWRLITLLPGKGERTIRIGDATATFRTRTRPEHRMLTGFLDERTVVEDAMSRLRSDDVFYDVGANLGMYACLAADIGCTVHAFEPTAVVADQLEDNAARNGGNVTVHRVGLSDETFEMEAEINMNWADNPKQLEMVHGDELIDEESLDPPTVVKIDVDGGELRVIRGLRNALAADRCRLVYCEVHPEYMADLGDDPKDVAAELHELGFTVEQIDERDVQYHLRAVK